MKEPRIMNQSPDKPDIPLPRPPRTRNDAGRTNAPDMPGRPSKTPSLPPRLPAIPDRADTGRRTPAAPGTADDGNGSMGATMLRRRGGASAGRASVAMPHIVKGVFDPRSSSGGVIGRDPACAIVLNDMLVSRRHCRVESTKDGIELTDLRSANGTYVNGRRVGRVWLQEGDVVTLGNTDLVVQGSVLQSRKSFMSTKCVSCEGIGLTVGRGAGAKRLLEGINANFDVGSLTAVIGPSGAGKSTFVKILAGLESPTEGHVVFDGHDVQRDIALLRTRIGFVPQDDVVHDKLKVDAALEYAAKLRLPGSSPEERAKVIDKVLDELELTRHRDTRIDRLSGGQRKRVSTAIELLTEPELLVLDEPTSGLDPALDLRVMTMLRKLADAGRVVVVVTHSLSYIRDVCDNVLMLAPGGRPAFYGSVEQMDETFKGRQWADIFNDVAEHPTRTFGAAPAVPGAGVDRHPGEKPPKPRRFSQTATLVVRQLHLVVADPGLLVFLLLLPLILGALSLVVPGDHGLGLADVKDSPTEPNQLLVLMILGACFMGAALSVRDIVSERPIYYRERAVGLSPTSYTASKLIVLCLETLLQSVLLVSVVAFGKDMPKYGAIWRNHSVVELVLVVWATAWVCAMLGAVGSSLVRSNEQTMPLLVIVVMTQLVFSGGMIPVTDRAGLEQVSYLFPARWGFAAAASTVDLKWAVLTAEDDPLWTHSAHQWCVDMAVLGVMLVVLTVALRIRMGMRQSQRS
ncbi:ATP-binding cassette domain-containing protein [Bifidobacterium sp. 82T24]|uniref:ATP-binding cassette domain-containing protein n=1 Tax=Bifidobacterium pluvialisilvae TaxID=2834436 RepID=UPI001C5A4C41|nr:ATP-binding cassette domain-containing protein [Bifidobacterium pluvialisilvae]MBW3087868.1 ATP-binding cassette domain-containing protein [Bifidobacterium pluvialisilvae]